MAVREVDHEVGVAKRRERGRRQAVGVLDLEIGRGCTALARYLQGDGAVARVDALGAQHDGRLTFLQLAEAQYMVPRGMLAVGEHVASPH